MSKRCGIGTGISAALLTGPLLKPTGLWYTFTVPVILAELFRGGNPHRDGPTSHPYIGMFSTMASTTRGPHHAATTVAAEDPAHDLPAEPLGPGSVFWYLTGDWRTLLLAFRALVFQTAYPMVGAGVGEYSVYKSDPYGRLNRTFGSLMAQTYGGAGAAAEGRRLIEMHKDIKGVDARGRRYSALNPEAYLWVHATIFESSLLFMQRFAKPLDEREVEGMFDEWRRIGLLLGIKDQNLPRSLEEFWEMWDRVSAKLENNPVVQDILFSAPRRPPYLPIPQRLADVLARPLLRIQRDIVASTVSPALRETFGLAPLTPAGERRVRRVAWFSRTLGRVLPDSLRYMPMALKARRRAMSDPTIPTVSTPSVTTAA